MCVCVCVCVCVRARARARGWVCVWVCEAMYLWLMVSSYNSLCTTAARCALCRLKTETEARCTISIICYLTTLSIASSFNLQCPIFPLRSSSSCLRLIPRLPVTYFFPSIFSSIRCPYKSNPTPAVTNPVNLPSLYCMYDIPPFLNPM